MRLASETFLPLTGPLAAFKAAHPDIEVLLHQRDGAGTVRVEDLADEPFVTTKPGQWQRRLLDWLFADRNLEPRIVCATDEPAATYALVSAGLGIGLFPTLARSTRPDPGVAWAIIDHPHCNRTLSLHWVSDDRPPAAVSLMRTQITDWNWGAAA
ncbi:MAG TPA: LysR family transcriptional regulator substrate-binding protein [Glycomyces sp.]|nr:LysR family transcriptional regulator substrate-binding protein [Glycomyces sp.]